MEMQAEQRMQENADAANKDEWTPMSPGSPQDGSKVKKWLKTKFSRRASRSQKAPDLKGEGGKKDFVGGAALAGASAGANSSTASLEARSSSLQEVALADTNKDKEPKEPEKVEKAEEHVGSSVGRGSEVSTVSSMSEDEDDDDDHQEFEEARDNFDEGLAPPPTFPAAKSSSPVRDSKFRESI